MSPGLDCLQWLTATVGANIAVMAYPCIKCLIGIIIITVIILFIVFIVIIVRTLIILITVITVVTIVISDLSTQTGTIASFNWDFATSSTAVDSTQTHLSRFDL